MMTATDPRNLSMEHLMKTCHHYPFVALSVAGILALSIAGPMGSAVAQAAKKVPSGDPCTVLPLSEVQKAFAGAKPGERSTRKEKYGITECEWKDGGGVVQLVVQEFYGTDSALVETQGAGMAMVESKPENARNVRYEVLTGLGQGSEAVAFVEANDAKRGVVHGFAMLTLHRGQRTLTLTSPRLQDRDRAAALKTLEALGRTAAKRLE